MKFLIQVRDLDRQSEYEFRGLNATELNLDKKSSIDFKKIDAEVSLNRSSLGIGADFVVSYSAEFTCMRCLGKFTRTCNSNLHLNYVEGEDPYLCVENVELTPHEADKVFYHGPQIDLSIGIREAIVFSLPITPLCRDDCPGLCPVCGIDLNTRRCSCKGEQDGFFTAAATENKKTTARKIKRNRK